MDNKGLKILVVVLAVVFAGCIAIAIIYKDDMDFKKAKKAGTKEAYAAFVEKHPDSEFFGAAKRSLDSIESIELKNKIEDEYQRIKKDPSLEDVKQFIASYPDSDHSSEFRQMIEEWDNHVYEELTSKYDASLASYYLLNLPEGKHVEEIRRLKIINEEEDVYKNAISKNTIAAYQDYIDTYPKGKHLSEIKSKLALAQEQDAYNNAKNLGQAYAYRDYLNRFPNGKHKAEIRGLLDEIEDYDRYKDNSLANGAQPYSAYYGTNKSCQYYGCSEICVKAPYSSDVLVLIKKDNSNGKVVRHGYVKGGSQVCFEVPDGRYQVFFYYGKGWYPKKQMQGGVKGGFLRDELFSKDNPQYLDGQILTYELILQQNGNFSTKPSSESEMF